jgi:hypothetical protein
VFDTATPPRVINESFKKLNGVVTEAFDLRYWPLLRERRSLGSNPRNCVGRATDNSPKCAIEMAGRRRRRRESAVEDQGTVFSPQRADAGKAACGVLKFYGARGKARRFA